METITDRYTSYHVEQPSNIIFFLAYPILELTNSPHLLLKRASLVTIPSAEIFIVEQ